YLKYAAHRLALAGVDSPALCARLLASHALGLDRLGCLLNPARKLTSPQAAALAALTARRLSGEPMAYIFGRREFFGREFSVNPHTLIPRPETELLVEKALAAFPVSRPVFFADIGTGCGCIGITLALERPRWKGMLLDNSTTALTVAKDNARALLHTSNVQCALADMRAAPLAANACDLLVSNPPYIREDDNAFVMDEVLRFEPHTALFSPDNGLARLYDVCRLAARCLRAGGLLLLEHGAEQGAAVRNALKELRVFQEIATSCDLAGHERCTGGQKGGV
ncbi:MAG: peptide chain release factor N(5)-glutamine methyltransferase, partial [Desulfovibrio sp.]|nr:peptide chain release factor N(5)-glutamine methyltransferase [Desulfovibrio sp.]